LGVLPVCQTDPRAINISKAFTGALIMHPETRYVKSGDAYIAYQVFGHGPRDLVYVHGFVSHIEALWQRPTRARFFERLSSFCRVVMFDKRGNGLSDRVSEIPTLEQRMDDVRAVMDAAGVKQAALFGVSEGGPMALLFAATYPERTTALILCGTFARWAWAPDHPMGMTDEQFEHIVVPDEWGGPAAIDLFAPSVAHLEAARQDWASYLRQSASPSAAVATLRMAREIDARHILPSIRVPTLVLHRAGEQLVRIEQARYLAKHIPGAKLVELEGNDHIMWAGDQDVILDEIAQFLTGAKRSFELDRVLATVLFTDIVGSTEQAAQLGDSQWRDVLERYYGVMREELARFRGREVDTAGDGLLAVFDAPARAVRCACASCEALHSVGIEVRAGLHTGECEVMGEKVGGIAVHIGARVAATAGPGEVCVSGTVKDLVAGSGLRFKDRGMHSLKGVPDEWHLYSVER